MAQSELTYSSPGGMGSPQHNVDLIVTYNAAAPNGDGSFTATAAMGTYTVLNNDGTVNHVDQITGIGPSGGFGGNDNHYFVGTQPYVDIGGLNYTISNAADTFANGNGTINFIYSTGNNSYGEYSATAGIGEVLVTNVNQQPYSAPTPTPTPTPTPAPCYVTGTRIRVLRGLTIQDVPVEHLRVGDLALTATGKPCPIRWIGTRAYPGLTAPKHDRPVRIKADALNPGVPSRDLLVSPDHCLWLDGLLVAAGHLINGMSIIRGEAVADLTYWHVELDSHDMLLVENTPAESFLAAPGVRAGFDGTHRPDATEAPVPYAPRAERHTPRWTPCAPA